MWLVEQHMYFNVSIMSFGIKHYRFKNMVHVIIAIALISSVALTTVCSIEVENQKK